MTASTGRAAASEMPVTAYVWVTTPDGTATPAPDGVNWSTAASGSWWSVADVRAYTR